MTTQRNNRFLIRKRRVTAPYILCADAVTDLLFFINNCVPLVGESSPLIYSRSRMNASPATDATISGTRSFKSPAEYQKPRLRNGTSYSRIFSLYLVRRMKTKDKKREKAGYKTYDIQPYSVFVCCKSRKQFGKIVSDLYYF